VVDEQSAHEVVGLTPDQQPLPSSRSTYAVRSSEDADRNRVLLIAVGAQYLLWEVFNPFKALSVSIAMISILIVAL